MFGTLHAHGGGRRSQLRSSVGDVTEANLDAHVVEGIAKRELMPVGLLPSPCIIAYLLPYCTTGSWVSAEPERRPQTSPPRPVWAPRVIQASGRHGPFGSSHRSQRRFRTVRTIRRN